MNPERGDPTDMLRSVVDEWATVQAPEAGMVGAIVAFLFILAPLATPMRPTLDRGGHGRDGHAPHH
mgnify:CR=1 FL=1